MSVGGYLNLGRDIISDALIGGATYARFDNANANIAVGNSAAVFARTHTDLQGVSKARMPVDAGFPTRATNVLTFEATADGNTANFAWEEWGIANGSAGVVLVRFVQALGTKASGTTWKVTATVTTILP